MEERLVGWFARAGGFLLLAVAAAGWLSLVTWSVHDPSLTHATAGLTRNWLGPLGAIVSDLLLQTLGFGTIFFFMAIAFVGGELICNERVRAVRHKAWMLPLAIFVLAGAFSSLPAPKSWPLNHGLGGLAGDAGFGLISGLFAIANPQRAGAATGFILFTAGLCLMSAGLGLSQREWSYLIESGPSEGRTLLSRFWGRTGKRRRADPSELSLYPETTVEQDTEHASAGHPDDAGSAGHSAPGRGGQHHHMSGVGPTPHGYPQPYPAAPYHPAQHHAGAMPAQPQPPRSHLATGGWHPAEPQQRPLGQHVPTPQHQAADPMATPEIPSREPAFENSTERGSRRIAERFAPSSNEAPPQRSAMQRLGGLMPFRANAPAFRRPSLNILKKAAAARPGAEFTQPVLRGNARLLEDVLNDFGIKGEIKDIRPGPVVTLFEFEPARGTKSSRVIALADDIARSMSAVSARVAVIPGRNAIGIELPNVRRETVYLRELLESEPWRSTDAQLPVVLGKAIGGEPVIADLARMPHLLVAGTTGSGKSVGVNAMIVSLIYRLSPAECRFLMIDPKMLELSVYNGIPHLLAPVVTDPHRAAAALGWVVSEMEERYKRMSLVGVRNIEIYNNRARNAKKRGERLGRTVQTGFDEATGQPILVKEQLDAEPMPYIVVIVDEFADLMAVAGKEVEAVVQRLAQMARAAGIHLIMATQRPSVDVVTGTIKANFPTRIAFKVASKVDSRTIINDQGAEQLLGAGDMLYSAGSGQTIRVHGPFVSDDEVEKVAASLREQGEPLYVDSLTRVLESNEIVGPSDDPADGKMSDSDDLFDRAVAIVHRDGKASTSYLQRRLSIGYNRAADLIERMEREGVVSPADNVGRRRVLIGEDRDDR